MRIRELILRILYESNATNRIEVKEQTISFTHTINSERINKSSNITTNIEIDSKDNGLKADSVVLAEQIRTIDKSRLKEKIGHIDDNHIMSQINNALGVSFGLD